MTAQLFIPTGELVIPIETTANEVNAEIETQPLTAEIKRKKLFKVILLIFFANQIIMFYFF